MSVPIRRYNRTHNSKHSLRSAVNFLLPAGRRNNSKLLFVTCNVEHGCSVAILHLIFDFINIYSLHKYSGPCSSVGIATGYGLHDPGIKSWWRRDFTHLSSPALGPTQPPVQWVPSHYRGSSGRGVLLTTHPF